MPSVKPPSKTRGPRGSPDARDIALGVVAAGVRAGVTAGRVALTPLRAAARAPVFGPAIGRAADAFAADGRELRERARAEAEAAAALVVEAPELERTVDRALAAPLTDAAARSIAEHNVVERVAGEVLARPQFQAALNSALESEQTRALVLASVESKLTAEVTERVLASPDVRAALTRQTTTFADELLARLRRRLRRFDDAVDRREPPANAYGGMSTRTVAFVADLAVAEVIFLLLTFALGLVAALVSELPRGWAVASLVGAGWLVVVGGYLALFWSLTGQTPGMRLMHVHVATKDGRPPSLARSLLRFAALVLAIVPLFAGFLPILFDRRRRGIQDMIAGTVVVAERPALPQRT